MTHTKKALNFARREDPPVTSTPEHTPWWSNNDDGQRLSVADHQLRKTRVMARKCPTCIFRPADPMALGSRRLAELIRQARATGTYIICHCSLPNGPYPDVPPAICRGFYDGYDTQALQIARRLWGFVEVDPPQPEPPSDTGTDPGPPAAALHQQGEQ
jgi:hypothetical protein